MQAMDVKHLRCLGGPAQPGRTFGSRPAAAICEEAGEVTGGPRWREASPRSGPYPREGFGDHSPRTRHRLWASSRRPRGSKSGFQQPIPLINAPFDNHPPLLDQTRVGRRRGSIEHGTRQPGIGGGCLSPWERRHLLLYACLRCPTFTTVITKCSSVTS